MIVTIPVTIGALILTLVMFGAVVTLIDHVRRITEALEALVDQGRHRRARERDLDRLFGTTGVER